MDVHRQRLRAGRHGIFQRPHVAEGRARPRGKRQTARHWADLFGVFQGLPRRTCHRNQGARLVRVPTSHHWVEGCVRRARRGQRRGQIHVARLGPKLGLALLRHRHAKRGPDHHMGGEMPGDCVVGQHAVQRGRNAPGGLVFGHV